MVAGRDENGRFVKGNSGNPKGRAPKEREQEYYNVLLNSVSMDDWRAIVTKAVTDAKRGDATARKFLADYLLGPPIQRLEHSGPDGAPVAIRTVGFDVDKV